MSWRVKTHFPSSLNKELPRCRTVRGWRMERVKWRTSSDINRVDCLECLKLRGKLSDQTPVQEVMEEARKHLISRLI